MPATEALRIPPTPGGPKSAITNSFGTRASRPTDNTPASMPQYIVSIIVLTEWQNSEIV